MRVISHGIDMVDCARLAQSIERHGQRFLRRVFTADELDYCMVRKRRIEHLAGRFAAKEAVLKVLGTGWSGGIRWTDIEVRNAPSGKPTIRLSGQCRKIADDLDVAEVLISITHIETHAIASAIGCASPPGNPPGMGD